MHIRAALHGVEASVVAQDALRKMRTAFVRSIWSDGLHVAGPGVVLGLVDGLAGCDLGHHVVWCRFRMLRRQMTHNCGVHDQGRTGGLLRYVAAGAHGHGPIHLLVSGAASIGFDWLPELCIWQRPCLPALCQLSIPFQYFEVSIER